MKRSAVAAPAPPIAAPSILSADFSRLAQELAIVDPATDWVHCDIMDNHFVPNLTFGPLLVEAVRALVPAAFIDVHLMIEKPESLLEAFRKAGADQMTFHFEAWRDPGAVVAAVKGTGARVGMALKPGTAFAAAERWLDQLDLLLVMTVEPGFGGQAFMAGMLPKVREAHAWREKHGARYLIEVDGGIAPNTATQCRAEGADVFVAGNAIFGQNNPALALAALRGAIKPARA